MIIFKFYIYILYYYIIKEYPAKVYTFVFKMRTPLLYTNLFSGLLFSGYVGVLKSKLPIND